MNAHAETVVAEQDQIKKLDLDSIVIREGHNPRKTRSKKDHALLTASIKDKGVMQSILVRPHPTQESVYEVVAGQTRFMIAKEIGLQSIPAIIRNIPDDELTDAAMTENITRFAMSPMDEGDAARTLVSEGRSKDEICLTMGWSIQKLDGRIQLTHCINSVRQAMADENISIGHAQLLSGLRAQAQASALKVIIGKNLTVDGFRDLLEGLSYKLASAPFDTKDCAACPHNSATQASLFDANTSSGKCLNKACFTEKSNEHLQNVKADLTEMYNKIEMSDEVAEGTTTIVVAGGNTGVGQEQLNACAGCEHYGAIIDTALGNRAQVKASICFNLTCHKEKVADYQSVIATDSAPAEDQGEQVGTASASSEKATQPAPETSGQPKPKAKPAKPSTPKVILDQHHTLHREAAADHLQANSDLKSAQIITLISMMADASIKPSTAPEGWPDSLHSGRDRTKAAILLSDMSEDDLNNLQIAVAKSALGKSFKSTATDPNDCYGALAEWYSSTHKADLSKHFVMDTEYLKPYTKPVIAQLLEKSGFAADFNKKSDDDKAFNALIKGKKPEILKAVEASDFDFTGFIPDQMKID